MTMNWSKGKFKHLQLYGNYTNFKCWWRPCDTAPEKVSELWIKLLQQLTNFAVQDVEMYLVYKRHLKKDKDIKLLAKVWSLH